MIRTKKGFSLVELVIALGIIIIMTGAAALYLGDIYFRAQVTKSLSDMETIGKSLLLHDTENGADLFETDLPAEIDGIEEFGDKDNLRNLLGNYLAVLPMDPWGNTYKVNAYAGWISTYAGNYQISGTSKYERSIKYYYLPEDLLVSKVRVEDNNANLVVDTDDTLRVYFTKSIRPNVETANVLNRDEADLTGVDASVSGFGPLAGGDDDEGHFTYQDFVGIRPDGLVTQINDLHDEGADNESPNARYSRPDDSPFTYNIFSRVLEGSINALQTGGNDPMLDGEMYNAVWALGNDVYIPTGVEADEDRSRAYMVWESTQGYLTYKTPGEINRLYLMQQSPELSSRTVLFMDLVD
ncbi:MAG: type II secretion system protein [Candidatus Muiribacteriota bacterium]